MGYSSDSILLDMWVVDQVVEKVTVSVTRVVHQVGHVSGCPAYTYDKSCHREFNPENDCTSRLRSSRLSAVSPVAEYGNFPLNAIK